MGKTQDATRGDRMKNYEKPWRHTIPQHEYVILRLDGKAFSTYTRGMKEPFDETLMGVMDSTAITLCQQISGSRFAYVQSDEISILLTHPGKMEPWLGGRTDKINSVAASIASSAFNVGMLSSNLKATAGNTLEFNHMALFDARVFTLPNHTEVLNYFLWRQRDCNVNYITMIAHCFYPKSELLHQNTSRRRTMLADINVDLTQYPTAAELGRVITRDPYEATVSFTHPSTGVEEISTVTRHRWQAHTADWFDWDQAGFLHHNIPASPKETQQ